MRTNLAFMDVDGKAKSLMVTSSLQGEGKSVTVANLAVTLALAARRSSSSTPTCGGPASTGSSGWTTRSGASSVAVGESDLALHAAPVQVVSPNGDGSQADFATGPPRTAASPRSTCSPAARYRPTRARSSRRSASRRCSRRCASEADVVLVDSPAMLAVGDTAALASEVDGLVFLVDMEKARRPVMQAAADQLYRLPCAMMGIIVRLPAGSNRDRYYYSHYGYSEGDGRARSRHATSGEPAQEQAVAGPLGQG